MNATAAPALLLALALALPLTAADEKEEERPRDAEEARREKVALIKERMRYFESHVGEWVGEEHYHIIPLDQKSDTRDEWKGFFSLEGTHFEMHGRGVSEDGPTTYTWICSYDAEEDVYRAWYFDSDGNRDTFVMEWDREKKVLVWTSEDEENERTSTFFMKVDGNEITGEGETTATGSDEPLIKHTMSYRKKRIRI
jgi:hypothetical protein